MADSASFTKERAAEKEKERTAKRKADSVSFKKEMAAEKRKQRLNKRDKQMATELGRRQAFF